MAAALIVPPTVEAVITKFDQSRAPLAEREVQQALGAARGALAEPTDAENLGAWADVLAFAVTDNGSNPLSARKTFFSLVSADSKDGATVYSPDIAGDEMEILSHWIERAKNLTHPVLKARYADLAWDMSRALAHGKPDPEMARTAIDAYLGSLTGKLRRAPHDCFQVAMRTLDLAVMIRDSARVALAKAALLDLHRQAVESDGLWWIAVNRLLDDKHAGMTNAERDQLVADLEGIVAKRSNVSDPAVFNPHTVEVAAKRLIKHYNKHGRGDDAKRLHEVIGRTAEHFASLANPMLASSVLQTAVNAFHDAGLPQESRRARIAMEEKIAQSHDDSGSITFEQTISREDMEKFLGEIVVPDLGGTFAKVAGAFLISRDGLEKRVAVLAGHSPLMAAIGQTIVAADHVAAKVGSVENDPSGRLIRQAQQEIFLHDMLRITVLHRAIEVHGAMPGHFAGWVARSGLFDDLTLLMEGVAAWHEQDFVKAVHVLVPQVEKGLRGIVSKLGKPATKRHSTLPGVSVAINMGDILHDDEIRDALGPELTLHFQTLYSDPRGFNLRNKVAHGLLDADEIDAGLASRVIHTLLVLGMWAPFAKAHR